METSFARPALITTVAESGSMWLARVCCILSLAGLTACGSDSQPVDEPVDSVEEELRITTISPDCAASGETATINTTGWPGNRVTVTVGDVEAEVTDVTTRWYWRWPFLRSVVTFVVPQDLPSGEIEVVATNVFRRSARIDWLACDADCVPTGPEVCDGEDNDCNDLIDDGIADIVTGSDAGECQPEIQQCVDGAFAVVQDGVSPSEEACDGLDNDCNGTADDEIADIVTGTDIGECQQEIQSCVDGAFAVVQEGIGPGDEVCDALDNDCNGTADDGVPDLISGTDVGLCELEIQSCVDGTYALIQPGVGPMPEMCDGLDNNCNGLPDDGIPSLITGTDVGECQPEVQSCVMGVFAITQFGIGPSPESCDALDNDCNGLADDGVADILTGTDVGECQQEIQSCVGGVFAVIQPGIGPSPEECDSLDNDCNGAADDGIAEVVTGTDVGECQTQIEQCVGGSITVVQAGIDPVPEECDALDNDCNGTADDGIADVVTGSDIGECQPGIDQCVDGVFVNVQPEIGPELEQCDGLDNDCTGTADNGIEDIVTGIDTGECEPQIESCVNGSFVITQFEVGPSPEQCDGLDNDCNAALDDGIADIVTGTNVGECQESIESCINGSFTVVQAGVDPVAEQCDSLDNDCNGQSDEGIADIITGSAIGQCQPEIQSCQGGVFVVTQAGIEPVAETCDGLDNDCNGVTDDEPVCSPVNQPPVLTDPGAMAVTVGSTLKFTLMATDGDTDPITYGVAPQPLPANAGFNMERAEFTFAPTFDEVGSYDLTFSASDGQASDEVDVTVDVLEPPPGTITELRGRVLDTTDALDGIDTPVVGATISLINTPYETTTDSEGYFALSGIPAGEQVFDINPFTALPAPDGGPYAGFREAIPIIEGAVNDHTRPFYIPRIAQESLTTVDPNSTTIVENATLGMTMTVAPGTAKGPNGENFTGQLSISLVPENLAPAQMPEGLEPAILVTVQPVGVTFSTPAPITFPNLDGLAPGEWAELWSLDPDVGRFVVVGRLEASADGQSLVTTEGGIRAADWHFASNPPLEVEGDPPPEDDPPPTCDISSDVDMNRGNLVVDHTTVAYRTLSRPRARRLVYNSLNADPQPIVHSRLTPRPGAPKPLIFSLGLSVEGVTSPRIAYDSTLVNNSLVPIRVPAQFDATSLPTGLYGYSLFADFGWGQSVSRLVVGGGGSAGGGSSPAGGGSGGGQGGFGFARTSSGTLHVNNQIDSPFGAGWTLAEQQQLHVSRTGDIAITNGNGAFYTYLLANRSDLAVCGASKCDRHDSGTGERIENFFSGGIAGRYRTFLPDGEMWQIERLQFGAHFRVHRYLPDGTALTPVQYDNTAEIPYIVATQLGNVYMAGTSDGAIYKFAPDASSIELAVPAEPSDCGRYTAIYPTALDPLDPTKEEVLAVGPDPAGGGELIWRVDLNDSNDDGVYCTGIAADIKAFGIPTFVTNIRQGPDRALFVVREAGTVPPAGLYRFDNGQRTMLLSLSDADGIDDIAIGPEDGLIYALVGGLSTPRRLVRLDPVTGVELSTLPDYTHDTGGSPYLDFFPRPVSQGDVAYFSLLGDYSTLAKNPDGSYTRTLKGGTKMEFDAEGKHVATVDRNGNTTSYGYDAEGKLVSIGDPIAGLVTTVDYDTDGKISRMTDPFGRMTDFEHDAEGNLTRIIDPDLSDREFEYDGRHRMVRQRSKRGFDIFYEYDFAGRLVRSVGADGSIQQIVPLDTVVLADVSTGVGTPENPAPLLPNEQQIASITDGDGVQTRMVMNRRGQVTGVERGPVGAPGSLQRFEHNEQGEITTAGDDGDPGFRYDYDSRGREITVTNLRTGGATRLDYESGSIQVTTADGESALIETDQSGNVTRVTDPRGATVLLEYESASGLATRLVGPLPGVERRLDYDSLGNLVAITTEVGSESRTTTWVRTPDGSIASVTDALGHIVEYEYDQMGRRTRTILPGGRAVQHVYDEETLVGLIPPDRPVHSFEYTPEGYPETYSPPLVGNSSSDVRFGYSGAGSLTSIDRPDGDVVSLVYDEAARLTRVALPSGDVEILYKAVEDPLDPSSSGEGGRVRSLTGPDDTSLTYTYDGGLQVGADSVGEVTGQVSTEYDASGRISALTVGSTAPVEYAYVFDRPAQAGEMTLAWDGYNDGPSAAALGSLDESWTYDPFGDLSEHSVLHEETLLYSAQYERDQIGRVTTIAETVLGTTATRRFTYDNTARLVTADDDNGSAVRNYGYDANDNRLSFERDGIEVVASYDAQDRLLQAGSVTYEHDEHGDRLSRTDTQSGNTTRYTYDAQGNLLSVVLPDGRVIDYTVDSLGRRLAKRLDGVRVQAFLYKDALNPVAELDGEDRVVSLFVYAFPAHVPSYMVKGNEVFRLVTDHLGSVRLVVNAVSGEIAQRIEYDEFGRIIDDTSPGFQPFGFAGGVHDRDAGLVRFGARDYDPDVGRWTTKDPIGLDGGPNLYAYVGNDPVNRIDVTGTELNCKQQSLVNKGVCFAAGVLSGVVSGGLGGVAVGGGCLILEQGDKAICEAMERLDDEEEEAAKPKPKTEPEPEPPPPPPPGPIPPPPSPPDPAPPPSPPVCEDDPPNCREVGANRIVCDPFYFYF